MKRSLLLLLSLILSIAPVSIRQAHAVPAYPYPITVTQSDGTQLTLRIVGDEFNHYTLTQEGYTVVKALGGDYFYAQLNNQGELVPTKILAKPISRLAAADRTRVMQLGKALRSTAVSKLRMSTPAQSPMASTIPFSSVGGINPPEGISSTITSGNVKFLVILVDLMDVQFTVPSAQEAFSNLLNQPGYSYNGANGSVRDYYKDNSNGQFTPEFVVVGPYKASRSTSYYAGQGGSVNVYKLVEEACVLAEAAGLDFTQFANNGVIRDVFIFFPGHNQAEGAGTYTIWPHRWDVRYGGIYRSFDGVQLQGYTCASEYKGPSGTTMAPIGTFSHEFGHTLGWPDFYDTDYTGSGGGSPALESFSLMCSGSYNDSGRTPPALNILERWMMGWAAPMELTMRGDYTLQPVTSDKGYLVRTSTNNDYFLFEYRGAGKTVWDKPNYIPGNNTQGMLVYHVDYTNPSVWNNNTINANPSHEYAKIVRSVLNTAGTPGRAFFPGTSNVTSLSGANNSDYNSWRGNAPKVSFTNISVMNNTSVSFTASGDEQLPDWKFKSTPTMDGAEISWQDPNANAWNVSWKLNTGGSVLGTQQVSSPRLKITGLKPATSYEVTIAPSPANASNPQQVFNFTTSELPNWQIEVETHPRDFVVSWTDPEATGWKVTWRKKGTGSDLGSQTVSESQAHISNLTPATDYELTITPTPANSANPAQTLTVPTPESRSSYPRIALDAYEYPADKPVLLSADISGDIKEVKWYVDGQASTQTYRKLSAGEHKIMLVVVGKDGTEEYIIKYILVK